MTEEDRLLLSAYKEIADISDHNNVKLVQNTCTGKIFVKKRLSVYNKSIYDWLIDNPIENMPRIYCVFEDNNILTVIEEYISGETLENIIGEKGLLNDTETAEIGRDICKILVKLHSSKPPIIHRDIKPSNIIISSDKIVKLLDMNAARWFYENSGSDTRLIGTAGFAAPEQYGFGQSSSKTDIYEVGALMSMLCYGAFPNEVTPRGKLGEIIKKCTAMEPEKRYNSASELIEVINNFLNIKDRNIFVSENKRLLRFLPPGFRTLNLSHMVVAALFYFLGFGVLWDMDVTGTSGVGLVATKVLSSITLILLIVVTGNWLDIQDRLPIVNSRNPWIRLLGTLLYDAGIITAMLVISILVVSSL